MKGGNSTGTVSAQGRKQAYCWNLKCNNQCIRKTTKKLSQMRRNEGRKDPSPSAMTRLLGGPQEKMCYSAKERPRQPEKLSLSLTPMSMGTAPSLAVFTTSSSGWVKSACKKNTTDLLGLHGPMSADKDRGVSKKTEEHRCSGILEMPFSLCYTTAHTSCTGSRSAGKLEEPCDAF